MKSIDDSISEYMRTKNVDYSPTSVSTEMNLHNITEMFNDSAFFNSQKNGNDSNQNVTETVQNNYMTVYDTYPPEILWFGAIFCIIFTIIGTIGNFISILALARSKKLKNATTSFILNLCAADMMYCVFSIPLTALTFIERNWNYGDALCKIYALAKFSNGVVSIFTIVAITINRYILIVYPQIYAKMYSPRNTAISIACLWIFPFAINFLPLFDIWGTMIYNPNIGDCGVNNLNGKSPRILIFSVVIILPSAAFIFCYLKIYFVVKKSVGNVEKQNENNTPHCTNITADNSEEIRKESNFQNAKIYIDLRDKKEFRLLRICLVLFIFYCVTIFPLSLVKLLKKEAELPAINVLAYIIYFSSSVMNPVIYIVMSREYRQAYIDLFTTKIC